MTVLFTIISFSFIGWHTFIKTHFPSSIICLSGVIVLKEIPVLMPDYFSLFSSLQNDKLMDSSC